MAHILPEQVGPVPEHLTVHRICWAACYCEAMPLRFHLCMKGFEWNVPHRGTHLKPLSECYDLPMDS